MHWYTVAMNRGLYSLSILLGMYSQSILFKCCTAGVAGEHIHLHLLTDYPFGDYLSVHFDRVTVYLFELTVL